MSEPKRPSSNERLIEVTILIGIICSALFFAIYKILDVPAGLQYDQLRAVLTPEFFTKGITDLPSIREIASYFILDGFIAHFLNELFRTGLSSDGMIFASRLPSAILFFQSAIVWWYLLKEFDLKPFYRIIFFAIFLPSATYVVFSHYIPLVAGYLFFTSASMYLFIRALRAKAPYVYLYLYTAIILAILSTYTHAISAFFVGIFYSVFLLLVLIFNRDVLKGVFKSIFTSKILAVVSIVTILIAATFTLYPFFEGYFHADEALTSRNSFTILYLIKNKEYDTALEAATTRMTTYLHPNTLVTGTEVTQGEQPLNTTDWFGIRNPITNQWTVNNLSPFGPITAFVYAMFVLFLFRIFKKDLAITFSMALLFSYVLLVIFPTYDNPSIAKTIPALMFIPLMLTLGVKEMVELLKDRKVLVWLFIGFSSLLVIFNAYYNLSYLYSPYYAEGEALKFEHSYDEAADYIAGNTSQSKLRIALHTTQWNGATFPEFFFSPYILNRTILINETDAIRREMFDLREVNVILTEFPADVDQAKTLDVPIYTETYKTPAGEDELFLIHLNPGKKSLNTDTLSATLIKNGADVICTNQPYYPFYGGEYENVHQGYRYYNKDNPAITLTDHCDGSGEFHLYPIDPADVYLSGTILTTRIPDDGDPTFSPDDITSDSIENVTSNGFSDIDITFKEARNITSSLNFDLVQGRELSHNSWELAASDTPAILAFGMPTEFTPGTFFFEFTYTKPEGADLGITITDIADRQLTPLAPLDTSQRVGEDLRYSTVYSLDNSAEAVTSLVLVNTEQLLEKREHVGTVTIRNFRVVKIASEDVVTTPIHSYEGTIQNAPTEAVTLEPRLGGLVYSGKIDADPDDVLLIQTPYSPFLSLSKNGLTEVDSKPVRLDGYVQGFAIGESHSGDIYLINRSVVLLAGSVLIGIIFYGALFAVMMPKEKSRRQAS
jgi:hypothetical protein